MDNQLKKGKQSVELSALIDNHSKKVSKVTTSLFIYRTAHFKKGISKVPEGRTSKKR